jgi:hypothetical protein
MNTLSFLIGFAVGFIIAGLIVGYVFTSCHKDKGSNIQ